MLKVFRSVPLARLIIPFICGIVCAAFSIEEIPADPNFLLWTLIALGISFLGMRLTFDSSHRNRWLFGIASNLSLIISGILITLVHSHQLFPASLINHPTGAGNWVLILEESPVEKNRSFKLEGKVYATEHTGLAGSAIVYVEKSDDVANLIVGDQLMFNTQLKDIETPGNPNEFNYPRFLRFNGILKQAYVPAGYWIKLAPQAGFHPVRWLRNLRSHLLEQLDISRFHVQERAVIAALTLGYKQELDAETTSSFAVAGAMHVLAVSGLHVGILYMLVNTMLKFLNRFKRGRIIRLVLIVVILFGYAGLTGMSASVFRAATMFSFVAWGQASKRSTNIYNTLAASALVLLIFDPYLIMQVGFQLSYAAVLGIVIIHPIIFNSLILKNRILDWAWNITCVSIAAQIATFPLGLLYFHQFPNYFLFSNLIVIPLATFIMYAGLLFYTVSWIPVVSTLVAVVLNCLTLGLNWAVGLIEQFPFAITSEIDISVLECILIYGIILSIVIVIHQRSFRMIYATSASLAVLLALQIIETRTHSNQEMAMIYNVRNGFAMDVISGTDHNFFSTDQLLLDESSMLFHVEHHWWFRDLEVASITNIDSLEPSNGLISILGNTVWLVPDSINLVPKGIPDVMVVTDRSDMIGFTHYPTSRGVLAVLSSNLSSWQIDKWKKLLNEKGIPHFSVSESGPYYFQKKGPLIAEGSSSL